MGRWVENQKNRVKSRHMIEQSMDWLDDPDDDLPESRPLRCWRSRDYSAMLFRDHDSGLLRLAITRVQIDKYTLEYRDGITWDALQQIKNETIGPDAWTVECYPPQHLVQNVANMRHLWILDEPPAFGWKTPTGEPDTDANADSEPYRPAASTRQIIIGGEPL
ncbi:DUF7694 domain-containing protein [Bifidobacterium scardovii]|uniref:DUF7694 domain-containing protein n=1 Tax=Bifidobacterium scardovii TaxID=158787 RepID=UPI00291B5FD2|nr:hypothetical protein [Bifidobacterium scardovii]MDU8982155.1 hypothetical protein [Bifidobacterium scardovii]